ncbi:hypothetical protein ACYZTM_20825 [Pseudomonas sp. MDT2-39-1]
MSVENSVEVRDHLGQEIIEGSTIKPGFVWFHYVSEPDNRVVVEINGIERGSSSSSPTALGFPFEKGSHTSVIKFQHQNWEKKFSFTVV